MSQNNSHRNVPWIKVKKGPLGGGDLGTCLQAKNYRRERAGAMVHSSVILGGFKKLVIKVTVVVFIVMVGG